MQRIVTMQSHTQTSVPSLLPIQQAAERTGEAWRSKFSSQEHNGTRKLEVLLATPTIVKLPALKTTTSRTAKAVAAELKNTSENIKKTFYLVAGDDFVSSKPSAMTKTKLEEEEAAASTKMPLDATSLTSESSSTTRETTTTTTTTSSSIVTTTTETDPKAVPTEIESKKEEGLLAPETTTSQSALETTPLTINGGSAAAKKTSSLARQSMRKGQYPANTNSLIEAEEKKEEELTPMQQEELVLLQLQQEDSVQALQEQVQVLLQTLDLVAQLASMETSVYQSTLCGSSEGGGLEQVQNSLDRLSSKWKLEETSLPLILNCIHRFQATAFHFREQSDQHDIEVYEFQQIQDKLAKRLVKLAKKHNALNGLYKNEVEKRELLEHQCETYQEEIQHANIEHQQLEEEKVAYQLQLHGQQLLLAASSKTTTTTTATATALDAKDFLEDDDEDTNTYTDTDTNNIMDENNNKYNKNVSDNGDRDDFDEDDNDDTNADTDNANQTEEQQRQQRRRPRQRRRKNGLRSRLYSEETTDSASSSSSRSSENEGKETKQSSDWRAPMALSFRTSGGDEEEEINADATIPASSQAWKSTWSFSSPMIPSFKQESQQQSIYSLTFSTDAETVGLQFIKVPPITIVNENKKMGLLNNVFLEGKRDKADEEQRKQEEDKENEGNFIVCGYKGFDTEMNDKPTMGARIIHINGQPVEDKWTLCQLEQRIADQLCNYNPASLAKIETITNKIEENNNVTEDIENHGRSNLSKQEHHPPTFTLGFRDETLSKKHKNLLNKATKHENDHSSYQMLSIPGSIKIGWGNGYSAHSTTPCEDKEEMQEDKDEHGKDHEDMPRSSGRSSMRFSSFFMKTQGESSDSIKLEDEGEPQNDNTGTTSNNNSNNEKCFEDFPSMSNPMQKLSFFRGAAKIHSSSSENNNEDAEKEKERGKVTPRRSNSKKKNSLSAFLHLTSHSTNSSGTTTSSSSVKNDTKEKSTSAVTTSPSELQQQKTKQQQQPQPQEGRVKKNEDMNTRKSYGGSNGRCEPLHFEIQEKDDDDDESIDDDGFDCSSDDSDSDSDSSSSSSTSSSDEVSFDCSDSEILLDFTAENELYQQKEGEAATARGDGNILRNSMMGKLFSPEMETKLAKVETARDECKDDTANESGSKFMNSMMGKVFSTNPSNWVA